jgi:hypothetical protein
MLKEGIALKPDQVICQMRTRSIEGKCRVSTAGMYEIGDMMDGMDGSCQGCVMARRGS